MEDNGAPVWAQELRKFTEFSLGRLEERLGDRMDSFEERLIHRMDSFEGRLTRKVENMETRIDDRFVELQGHVREMRTDVVALKDDVAEITLRLQAVERR